MENFMVIFLPLAGKYQLTVVGNVGHSVQEDSPGTHKL